MKRRGFLKFLVVAAAVPAVTTLSLRGESALKEPQEKSAAPTPGNINLPLQMARLAPFQIRYDVSTKDGSIHPQAFGCHSYGQIHICLVCGEALNPEDVNMCRHVHIEGELKNLNRSRHQRGGLRL